MLIKYTRKQINQQDFPRSEEFVLAADAERMLMEFIEAAVDAGADQGKLLEAVTHV